MHYIILKSNIFCIQEQAKIIQTSIVLTVVKFTSVLWIWNKVKIVKTCQGQYTVPTNIKFCITFSNKEVVLKTLYKISIADNDDDINNTVSMFHTFQTRQKIYLKKIVLWNDNFWTLLHVHNNMKEYYNNFDLTSHKTQNHINIYIYL